MILTFDHWQLFGIVGFLLVGLGGMGKVLLAQIEKRLDARFAAMEASREASAAQWRVSFSTLDAMARESERRITQLLIDLPLQYQRREDAIRQEVAIIHRLDALGVKVDSALRSKDADYVLERLFEIKAILDAELCRDLRASQGRQEGNEEQETNEEPSP